MLYSCFFKMNIIFSICVYFLILQFCAGESFECIKGIEEIKDFSESTIYLVVPNYKVKHDFERIFEYTPYNRLRIIPEFCPGGMNGTLRAIQYIPNLINLFVSDFFKINYATILDENIVYVGKTINRYKENCTDNGLQYLTEPVPDTCYDAKLISKSIVEETQLYHFVLTYQSANTDMTEYYLKNSHEEVSKLSTVLICIEEKYKMEIQNYIEIYGTYLYINTIFDDIYGCGKNFNSYRDSHRLVAILAPKPFNMGHEIAIPTVFYDEPYLSYDDKSMFPMSISVIGQWQPLTHAFVAFMTTMKWKRVAMISDDSEYSEKFETEMLPALDSYRFTYKSYVCSNECNFEKMVNTVLHVDARIVIVNIGENNVNNFIKSIRNNGNSIKNIVWLVRDWPLPHWTSYKFYLISLGIDKHQKSITIDQNVYNKITTGIEKILSAYSKFARGNNDDPSIIKKMYSELKNPDPEQNALALVTEHFQHKQTLKMVLSINKNNQVYVRSGMQFHIVQSDRHTCEIIDTERFSEPCGDLEVLLMFLILTVFCVVILLVAYYINNVAYTNSYTNL